MSEARASAGPATDTGPDSGPFQGHGATLTMGQGARPVAGSDAGFGAGFGSGHETLGLEGGCSNGPVSLGDVLKALHDLEDRVRRQEQPVRAGESRRTEILAGPHTGLSAEVQFKNATVVHGHDGKGRTAVPPLGWDRRFEILERFIEEQGTARVPQRCNTAKYPGLGDWVMRQRYAYRIEQRLARNLPTPRKLKRISAERIAKLNSVGFFWGTTVSGHTDENEQEEEREGCSVAGTASASEVQLPRDAVDVDVVPDDGDVQDCADGECEKQDDKQDDKQDEEQDEEHDEGVKQNVPWPARRAVCDEDSSEKPAWEDSEGLSRLLLFQAPADQTSTDGAPDELGCDLRVARATGKHRKKREKKKREKKKRDECRRVHDESGSAAANEHEAARPTRAKRSRQVRFVLDDECDEDAPLCKTAPPDAPEPGHQALGATRRFMQQGLGFSAEDAALYLHLSCSVEGATPHLVRALTIYALFPFAVADRALHMLPWPRKDCLGCLYCGETTGRFNGFFCDADGTLAAWLRVAVPPTSHVTVAFVAGDFRVVTHYRQVDLCKRAGAGRSRALVLCFKCHNDHCPRLHAVGLARQHDTARRTRCVVSVVLANAAPVYVPVAEAFSLKPEHVYTDADDLDCEIAEALRDIE
jgi:hypothetical protein